MLVCMYAKGTNIGLNFKTKESVFQVFISSLGTYGYPSRSFVMVNYSFQLKYRYG